MKQRHQRERKRLKFRQILSLRKSEAERQEADFRGNLISNFELCSRETVRGEEEEEATILLPFLLLRLPRQSTNLVAATLALDLSSFASYFHVILLKVSFYFLSLTTT